MMEIFNRLPRSSMRMDPRYKDLATGCIPDPLPNKIGVPIADSFPSAHETMLLNGSTSFRKRNRRPEVDLRVNPQCEDRQLMDQYEVMRMNRNPALYTMTQADKSKSESMLHQREDRLTDADVNTVKLNILDSNALDDAALSLRRDLHDGIVKRRPLDRRLVAENIPHFELYNRELAVGGRGPTYGQRHRPRIYNPLSHDLIRAKKEQFGKRPHAPGMSVAQLRDLLNTDGDGGGTNAGTRALQEFAKAKQQRATIGSEKNRNTEGDIEDDLVYDTKRNERPGWDDTFCTLTSIRQSQNVLPHPGTSTLQREAAMKETFREKLGKSKQQAAGAHFSVFRLETQSLDREDSHMAAQLLMRRQESLSEDLSPRREYQREEIRRLLKERRRRDLRAADRVEQFELDEAKSKVPIVVPVQYGSRGRRSWNNSTIIER
jgi:hypothetical protein